MWSDGKSADAIIEAQGLKQITDSGAIEGVIDAVIAANPKQLADYRSGKDKLFGFFVGQVMKATGGKANPAQLNELLKRQARRGGRADPGRFPHRCMTGTACIASCSSNIRFADTWCISMRPGALDRAPGVSRRRYATPWAKRWRHLCCWRRRSNSRACCRLQLQGDGPVHLMLAQCTSGLGCGGWRAIRDLRSRHGPARPTSGSAI
jgi:hypothetical protein